MVAKYLVVLMQLGTDQVDELQWLNEISFGHMSWLDQLVARKA